jgi:hypothetical protein
MPDSNNNSAQNTQLLHKLIQLMEGEPDAPGVLARISLVEAVLFGRHGKDGLVTKVNFMWRAHVWVLCALSGAFGFLFRELLLKLKP